ncbi:hypothetical protein JCM11251_000414 [Rhodosporidiobolus azoricus]
MVILDGVKFACQTCIKGHRTTTCGHNDRPLYEIKKQGRPRTLTTVEMSRSQIVIEKAASTSDGKRSPTPATDEGIDDDASRRYKKRKQPDFARPDLPHGTSKLSRPSSPKREATPACPPSIGDTELEPCACLSGGLCDCPEALELAQSSAATSPVLDLVHMFSLANLPTAPLPFFDISAYPPSTVDTFSYEYNSCATSTSDSVSASTGQTSPSPSLDLDAAEWCTSRSGCLCPTCSWTNANEALPTPPIEVGAIKVEEKPAEVKEGKTKIKLCGEGCSCVHRDCTHCVRGPVTLSALISLASRIQLTQPESTFKSKVIVPPSAPCSAPASPPALAAAPPPPAYAAMVMPHMPSPTEGKGQQVVCGTTRLRCLVSHGQATVEPPALAV